MRVSSISVKYGCVNQRKKSMLAEAFCTTEGIDVVRPEPLRATFFFVLFCFFGKMSLKPNAA